MQLSKLTHIVTLQHALDNGGENLVDRINVLVDELLCHILYFLRIKHAFTTT